jgi:hypothetical protein
MFSTNCNTGDLEFLEIASLKNIAPPLILLNQLSIEQWIMSRYIFISQLFAQALHLISKFYFLYYQRVMFFSKTTETQQLIDIVANYNLQEKFSLRKARKSG